MEKIKVVDVVNNEFCKNDYISTQLPSRCDKYILKHMSIVNRLVYINEKIEIHYNTWKTLINSPKIDHSTVENLIQSALSHKEWQHKLINNYFEQEEIVAHLRKVIDDCIAFYSLVYNCLYYDKRKKVRRYFESIGEFIDAIKHPEEEQRQELIVFSPHLDYLRTINNISNGFKHCIINTTTMKFGRHEPCIFVYFRDGKYVSEKGITLNELIIGFNNFYSTFDAIIKKQ